MDIQKTAREIGLFETAVNLSVVCGSKDVIQKVGASMPLPDENIVDIVSQIAEWLCSFEKKKYMFLMPEIAVIEAMAKITDTAEVIIVIPCDLEDEAKERLKNNLPRGIAVSILEEPFFPQSFYPGNGMIVVSGYSAGGRSMVLPDTYRMVEHYNGFLGKKVFIPYKELDNGARYDEWMEVNQQKLSMKWSEKS